MFESELFQQKTLNDKIENSTLCRQHMQYDVLLFGSDLITPNQEVSGSLEWWWVTNSRSSIQFED